MNQIKLSVLVMIVLTSKRIKKTMQVIYNNFYFHKNEQDDSNEIHDNPHFVVSTKIGFENKVDFDDKEEREFNNLYAL